MTLILGMSKPEGIYMCTDLRVTDGRTGKLIDDASSKCLSIQFLPLANPPAPSGPRALLAFTGLAILRDGTPTLTWIRETLRGKSQTVDQLMDHLRVRLNRDIGPQRQPLMINMLVTEHGGRRLLGGFTNLRRTAGSAGGSHLARRFEYSMTELSEPIIFANGSGAPRSIADGHLDRLRPHLDVVPREPMNHMKLLASVNRRVAAKVTSVSPFSKVAFVNDDERFGPVSHTFLERGETAPFEMPALVGPFDITDWTKRFHEQSMRFFQDPTYTIEPDGPEQMTRDQQRRP